MKIVKEILRTLLFCLIALSVAATLHFIVK